MWAVFQHGHYQEHHIYLARVCKVHRPTCLLFFLLLKASYLHKAGTLTWLVNNLLIDKKVNINFTSSYRHHVFGKEGVVIS